MNRYQPLLLISFSTLFLFGCGTTQPQIQLANPTPPKTIQDSSSDRISKYNASINAGVEGFLRSQGVESLLNLVSAQDIGQVLDVSADKSAVLLQPSSTSSDGQLTFLPEVVYVNIKQNSKQLVSSITPGRFRLGKFKPGSNSVAAVASYENGQTIVVDFLKQQVVTASKIVKDSFPSELEWNPTGTQVGALLVADMENKLAHFEAITGSGLESEMVIESSGNFDGIQWQGVHLTEKVTVRPSSFNNYPQLGNLIPLKLPFASGVATMTNGYAGHLPYNGSYLNTHPALDFVNGPAGRGQAVLAASAGVVTSVVDQNTLSGGEGTPGNYIILEHPGPNNARFSSIYYHVQAYSHAINRGDSVAMGQKLGTVGDIGYTDPVGFAHIHFQVNTTSNPYGAGGQALPEPMDGYATFSAQSNYTSTNSGGGTVPPPVTTTAEMISKSGANTSLNFNTGVNVFNLWGTNPSDGDQLWDIFKPGQFNGNAGWMVRRRGTNTCLNSYRPNLANGVKPNPFSCDPSDGDQQWEFNDKGGGDWEIKLKGTGYCLDAPDSSQNASLVMNGCNSGASQKWKIPAAVTITTEPPIVPANCAYPGTMAVSTGDESGDFSKQGLYPQYWWREGSSGDGGGSTFTYTVSGATENFADWNMRPPQTAIYDLYAYTPNPTEDTHPLGNYGNQTPAEGLKYSFYDRDAGGSQVGLTTTVNQTRGCWQKILAGITLEGGRNYFLRLGDHANQADRKIYFDTVGLFKVGELPDTTAPTVSIASPSEGQTLGSSTVAVSGNAGDNRAVTGLQYSLNGAAVVPIPAGTTFNFNVTLNPGTNTIKVIAGDAAGNTASVTRTVTFTGTPLWQPNKAGLQFTDTIGGGAATAQTFTLSNVGNGTGSYSISSNQTWLTANLAGGSLAVNANATISVAVTDCTAVSNDTGTLTISGSGSSVTVNVTRTCIVTPPTAPGISSITMSSNGRIFIAWPEVSGATQYDFQATFGGAAISVTGQAPNRGGANGSAVATFLSAPDAADKQGKQVCFSMRASNTGGSSAFSSFACTTYKFYAGGLSVQSSSDVPRLTLK
jgi:hypothetical protein